MFRKSKPRYNLRIKVEELPDTLSQKYPKSVAKLKKLQEDYEGYFTFFEDNQLKRGRVEGLPTHGVELTRDNILYPTSNDLPLYLVEKGRKAYLSANPNVVV